MAKIETYYTRTNFPHLMVRNGNWDICANEAAYCASIPSEEGAANGCAASRFGDADYVLATLGVDVHARLSEIVGGRLFYFRNRRNETRRIRAVDFGEAVNVLASEPANDRGPFVFYREA